MRQDAVQAEKSVIELSEGHTAAFLDHTHAHLLGAGWQPAVCPRTGCSYYAKRPFPDSRSAECCVLPDFIGKPPRRPPFTALTVWRNIQAFFADLRWTATRLDNIVNPVRDTLFVSAAIQVLSTRLHAGLPMLSGPVFVGQPCIRLNFLEQAGNHEGISTSFVNVATLQPQASPEDFVTHLDAWLNCFSRLGLHANDFTLSWESTTWKKGPFVGRCLAVNYLGLELGEGIVIGWTSAPLADSTPILDFGFGLERIVWAVNRSRSYFTWQASLQVVAAYPADLIDCIRTLTLMALSAVLAGNRGCGYRFRLLACKLARQYPSAPLETLVRDAYRYWASFLTPEVPAEYALATIAREVERAKILHLCEVLNCRPPGALRDDLGTFALSLLGRGLPLDCLLEALRVVQVGSESIRGGPHD